MRESLQIGCAKTVSKKHFKAFGKFRQTGKGPVIGKIVGLTDLNEDEAKIPVKLS